MLRKYRIRWCILLLSIMAAVWACVFLRDMRREAAEAAEQEAEQTGETDRGLVVFAYAADGSGGCKIIPWYAEKEEQYLLFLPDWASAISFSKDILLEGRLFAGEKRIDLAAERGSEPFLAVCEGQEYRIEPVGLSRLPTLCVDTASGNLGAMKRDKQYVEEMELRAIDASGSVQGYAAGRMHCRGNVTFEEAEKKSYAIELDRDTDLYGMGEAAAWVLLANSFDGTSMRNYLTFYMADRLGLYGTPQAQWVDLYANGEYQGIYLLCEKVEIDAERLDIQDLEAEAEAKNDLEAVKKSAFYVISDDGQSVARKGFRLEKEPEDISGGYLLELEAMPERYEEGKSGFVSDNGQQVVIKSPRYASVSQVNYISGLYQAMEDALYSGDGAAQDAFLEYIDLDSITKKYLIEEFSKNVDASMSSCFLYKPEDAVSTRLCAGPVWDYDRAYGNMSNLGQGLDMRTPEDLFVRDGYYGTPFWLYFCLNPLFHENVKKVFTQELLPLADECVRVWIPQWEGQIRASVYADLRRWPDRVEEVGEFQELSYEEKVERLTAFMTARGAWLRQEWGCE